jgi:LysM repeat protein
MRIFRLAVLACALTLVSILGVQSVSAQDVTSASVAAHEQTYSVRHGDTLRDIATHYGVTWQAIAQRNNLVNPNRIYPGQVLVIPSTAPQPTPVPPVQPVPPATTTYVVQHGDTLGRIAARFNTDFYTLASWNHLANANRIYPGQVLVVPAGHVNPPAPQPTPVPPVQPPANFYVVRYGDTLLQISRTYGVDVWELARINSIYNLNHIYVGQHLRIR